uniref:Uncharacterized protein n=1 Tax=Opuntia streptacantha TaxID=393608 RepID=A0A7C8ZJS2_OPUST
MLTHLDSSDYPLLVAFPFSIGVSSLHTLDVSKQFLIAPPEVIGVVSFADCIQLLGFCTFEASVGIFLPSTMKMRSQYIPEEKRSTIMNFFCIPLNICVHCTLQCQGIPHNGHAWYVVNFPVCCIYIAEAAFGYCREPKTTCVD